jgi:hypothetical protein
MKSAFGRWLVGDKKHIEGFAISLHGNAQLN